MSYNPYANGPTANESIILSNPMSDIAQVARVKDQIHERQYGFNPHNYEKVVDGKRKAWNRYFYGTEEPQEAL